MTQQHNNPFIPIFAKATAAVDDGKPLELDRIQAARVAWACTLIFQISKSGGSQALSKAIKDLSNGDESKALNSLKIYTDLCEAIALTAKNGKTQTPTN